jgi:hypothetical protein
MPARGYLHPQEGTLMHDRPSYHDLERRIRDLESAMAGTARAHGPRRRPPHRRLVVAIATVMVLAMPMMTVASDRFGDVDDANPFHDAINELYAARITRGCATNPRRFCPDDAVTRSQMAGFLTRGLGRLTWDEGGPRAGTNSVASVTVDAGGLPGGKGYVLVNASVSAASELNADEEAAPSLILFAVEKSYSTPYYDHEADEVDWDAAFNLFGPPAPIFEGDPADGGFARASGSTSEVFVVPSGEATILDLVIAVEKTDPTSNVEVYGKITALYVPFGEDAPVTP